MEWYPVLKTVLTADWGESHYIGPLHPEAGIPDGAERWVTGFNHQPWVKVCKYFLTAYKNGGIYPPILVPISEDTLTLKEDKIIFWYPPHLNVYQLPLPTDPLPCPANAHLIQPKLVACFFLTEWMDKNAVTKNCQEIRMGSDYRKLMWLVSDGFHMKSINLLPGVQTVSLSRGGERILVGEGELQVTSAPVDRWNYNLYVQEVKKV